MSNPTVLGRLSTLTPTVSPQLSARLREGSGRGWFATLRSYVRLMNAGRFFFPLLWLLGNMRHCPVYIFPLLIAHLFDLLVNDPARVKDEIGLVMAVTCGLCLMNMTVAITQSIVQSRQRRSMTALLRTGLMRRLYRLNLTFHDNTQAGVLQNKFTSDLGHLENLQNYVIEMLLVQGTTIAVCLLIVLIRTPHLAPILMLTVIANLLIGRLLWRLVGSSHEEFRLAESGFLSALNESLSGARLARAHASENFTLSRLGSAAHNVAERGVKLDVIYGLFGCTSWAVGSVLQMLVIGIGAWFCIRGTAQLGDLYVFFQYYVLIAASIAGIVNGMPLVAAAGNAIQSLSDLFKDEQVERNTGQLRLELKGHVELRDVSFAYAGNSRHSLKKVNLSVPPGTSLALVGPSGSGKSTVASLLLGFYEPQEGAVALDGHDLRSLDLQGVRSQMSFVSQDVVLFQDTILSNIAWGDAKPNLQRAKEAARQANAEEFILRLSHGYDTILAERGGGLSGGQRQRLSIARALYRNPQILILDEATSALDPESERLVQAALDRLTRGRTTVIIAHRLSTIRNADKIAVMQDGAVVESGTYAELLAAGGAFSNLASETAATSAAM